MNEKKKNNNLFIQLSSPRLKPMLFHNAGGGSSSSNSLTISPKEGGRFNFNY